MLAGNPLTFRATPLAGDPFVGVQATAPPGGQADVRCALDGTVRPDGSVDGRVIVPDPEFPHPEVHEALFASPGAWTCVARGTVEGLDDNRDTAVFATPWSAPLRLEVRSDFRRRTGTISRARSKRPRFTFVAEWPAEASGGRANVALFRFTGCKGRNSKLRKVATYRGRFDAKRLRITAHRPRAGFYIGRFSFAGTHFVRASVDPNPLYLVTLRGRLEYTTAREFPACPGS